MRHKVSVSHLQKHLPEILDRAVIDDDVCLVQRNGESVAVIVSMREWRRRSVGEQLDALGSEFRVGRNNQQRTEELLSTEHLTTLQRRELDSLLAEADEIMLRRAEALDRV